MLTRCVGVHLYSTLISYSLLAWAREKSEEVKGKEKNTDVCERLECEYVMNVTEKKNDEPTLKACHPSM